MFYDNYIDKQFSTFVLIGIDIDSAYDGCSSGKTISMAGKNIGNLLNDTCITWGWFQGGFKPSNTLNNINSNNNSKLPVCNT